MHGLVVKALSPGFFQRFVTNAGVLVWDAKHRDDDVIHMVEIISLLVLQGFIADMARRRERSTTVFRSMLFLCWFGCEFAAMGLAYLGASALQWQRDLIAIV